MDSETVKPLTPRLMNVMRTIQAHFDLRGEAPTQVELAEAMGLSKVTVWEHVHRLVDKGYISIAPGGPENYPIISIIRRIPDRSTFLVCIGTVNEAGIELGVG